ncbi:MAG: cofactor-independent phosphoglycerate mutase [Clostridia bacterium]|nr:cofactor-independent phosphoglycerate mutase [Clostridia bacterium]
MKKYLVILFDGMADYPNDQGKTPMVEANKPTVDALASRAEVGLCQTVPAGMKPGSDVANLSVMGYDPKIYYTGRSPLEALSIGVAMNPEDVSYRCNLVTLSADEPFENKTMVDYSSGEITTDEARELILYLADKLTLPASLKLFPGISYRHCLLRLNGKTGMTLTPPHDISDRKITQYLPKGEYADEMLDIMKQSYALLIDHPVNIARVKRGLNPATSVWFWGEGRKPLLTPFSELRNKSGAVISAVDLIKGIGIGAKMTSIDVEGATGNIETNFDGKAQAGIDALKTHDFVYIHVEAPDECGHQGQYAQKTESIGLIDSKIVKPIIEHLRANSTPFKIAILPDHATPIKLKTHVSDPVPYLIYDSENEVVGVETFNEFTAKNTGITLDSGVLVMEKLLS